VGSCGDYGRTSDYHIQTSEHLCVVDFYAQNLERVLGDVMEDIGKYMAIMASATVILLTFLLFVMALFAWQPVAMFWFGLALIVSGVSLKLSVAWFLK
jgi:hypothetical protein